MYKWLEKQVEHVNTFYDDPERLKFLSPWDCPLAFRASLLDCLKIIAKNRLEEYYFLYNAHDFIVDVDEDIYRVYLIDNKDENSYIPIVRSSYMPDFILNNSNEYFIGSFREKNEREEETADDFTEDNSNTITKESDGIKMTYFIYVKRPDTNTYVNCYLEDWFTDEFKAHERAEYLNRTCDNGYHYIVVKIG